MRTISDDRRAIAKAIMLELQCHDFGTRLDSGDFRCSSAQIDLLEACCNAAADRVIALRTPPSGEAGEVTERFPKTMGKVQEAIDRYVDALLARQHGGVAQDVAFNSICEAVGRSPIRELDLRRALPTIKEPTDGK